MTCQGKKCERLETWEHVRFHLDEAERYGRRARVARWLSLGFAVLTVVFAIVALARIIGGAP